jgi:hypothetical protein
MKRHGKAVKEGNGWRVEFSEDFLTEMKDMPAADREAMEELIEGLKDGSIDPLKMGIKHCGYCGSDIRDAPPEVDMCVDCIKKYQ